MKKIIKKILRWPWSIGTAIVLLWNRTKRGKQLVVKDYTLRRDDLPKEFEGFRIVHLTDLHGRVFGENQHELLEKIDRLHPDVVFLTGDMYAEATKPARRAEVNSLMKSLSRKYPVYAILGNHEMRSTVLEDIIREMQNAGVRLLRNESVLLQKGKATVGLAGLETDPMEEFMHEDDPEEYRQHLQEATRLFREKNLTFTMLLAHKPELLPTVYSQKDIDLVFSGHAHGGLCQVPLINKRLLAPGQGLFPRYTEGLYLENHTLLLLSTGLGGPRFRIQPEIVAVTLTMKKKKKNC